VDEQAFDDGVGMSSATAEAVAARAAQVASAGMPLASGLRAAAQEADSWRVAWALRSIARQLENGQSLEDCLSSTPRVPPYLSGLIRAARRSGDFGSLLAQWLENRRAARQHWRRVLASLIYPALALALTCGVFLLFSLLIVPTFRVMFQEMGMKLPANTVAVLWLCDAGSGVLISILVVGFIALIVVRLVVGSAGWSLMMTSLPLVGTAWHWTGTSEMLRCLGLLVENQVPLSEALRLTADGITDGHVGSQCQQLATRVENGTSLTMSLIELRTLPLSIVPLVHWGERHGALGEGLRSAAEMLEGRLKFRAGMLVQIIPPVMLVVIGWMVLAMVIALFSPLIILIQGLT
jgi:type II secretory pathway component PulF